MNTRVVAAAALTFLLAAPAELCYAWDPSLRVQAVDEAVRFMPASLRLALERHREDVRRGMLEPMTREDGPEHRPASDGGALDRAVADAAEQFRQAVAKPLPFAEIARRLGVLAHYVADASYPPGASGSHDIERYAHFERFASSRLAKFPLVFLGHDDADLEHGDFAAFARRVAAEAAREDVALARAYAAAGNPPDPAAFDDRSIPFAVASLSYSRTVNYVVRAWLASWRRAGGDMGFTPYLKAQRGGAAPSPAPRRASGASTEVPR